ncbi:MAG TPA: IS630 family transposase [Candidatus Aenigmarchaeota archaeon]|nr:IS630 family transposase [Candidatus Aenigmarchaeota archaeon]HEX32878.1 IS630 family transposase [Candidatus Aenigmarchaeota archaeon]
MEKRDARKLKISAQQELRERGVKMREQGMGYKEIGQILDVHHTTVSTWYAKYKRDGKDGIKIKTRGRKEGDKKTLNPSQEAQIIKRLIDTTPKQLKFKYVLWTREAVRKLIKYEFGEDMPISTVGKYLQRWEFTSQVPIKRAYERNDKAVQTWLKDTYPAIEKQSKEENAEIQWADETACVSLPSIIKGYAPKGKTPVMEHTAKKFKINMISSITNRGKLRFMVYEQNMDANLFITFLERLIASSDKKIYLILDNLRIHHAKLVKAWVEEHQKDIALFYLPAYSPDLNPDEYLNNDFKRNVNAKHIPINKKELAKNTEDFMTKLSQDSQRISNYFKHEKIAYTAAS